MQKSQVSKLAPNRADVCASAAHHVSANAAEFIFCDLSLANEAISTRYDPLE